MTCDVQELISTNPCLSSLNAYQLELVITAQLCQIKNKIESGEEVTCDIQELLDSANCFNMLQMFELKVLQAQLLCDISNLL